MRYVKDGIVREMENITAGGRLIAMGYQTETETDVDGPEEEEDFSKDETEKAHSKANGRAGK